MGIGPKNETRDCEGPKGKRIQRHQFTRIAEIVQEDLSTHWKRIP